MAPRLAASSAASDPGTGPWATTTIRSGVAWASGAAGGGCVSNGLGGPQEGFEGPGEPRNLMPGEPDGNVNRLPPPKAHRSGHHPAPSLRVSVLPSFRLFVFPSFRLPHARGESRTRMGLPPADFESAAYAIPPLGPTNRNDQDNRDLRHPPRRW